MLPVEAFATGIKVFDRQKVCLIAWLLQVKGQIAVSRFLQFGGYLNPLISSHKKALITWFNFDPSQKRFYTGHTSDYPLTIITNILLSTTELACRTGVLWQDTVWTPTQSCDKTWRGTNTALQLWPLESWSCLGLVVVHAVVQSSPSTTTTHQQHQPFPKPGAFSAWSLPSCKPRPAHHPHSNSDLRI